MNQAGEQEEQEGEWDQSKELAHAVYLIEKWAWQVVYEGTSEGDTDAPMEELRSAVDELEAVVS